MRLLILVLALGLAGCATGPAARVAAPVYFTEKPLHDGLTVSTEEGWWRVSFAIARPALDATQWHLDPLIAHQIVVPVLVKHEQHLIAWRFHRRAADDATGHQFSFIFFAHRAIADQVYADVQQNPTLIALKQSGRITQDSYTDTAAIARPLIDDTSDPSWSAEMQASWPIYINGVSQMWLTLVDIYARQIPAATGEESIDALEARYRQVNQKITSVWRQEGQHALLHHLNAIFGYEPLLIRDVQEKRF